MGNQPIRWMWARATGALLMVLLIAPLGFAVAAESSAPYFRVLGDTDKVERLPLEMSTVDATITGVVADVRLSQNFVNRGDRTIEAVYVFPASTRAAVYAVTMSVGGRVVKARIQEKNQARATYQAARSAGRTASLLEQQEVGVFQMKLANILPGDRIKVELSYTELLVPTEGVYEFFYPNTFSEHLVVAGPHDLATPGSAAPEVTDYSFDFNVHLLSGVPIESVESPSHELVQERRSAQDINLHMAESEVQGSRKDLLLRYRLSGGQIETGMVLSPGSAENFFLLMAEPPKTLAPEQIGSREFIFVIDVSGSMAGSPLDLAKQLLHDLLETLRPTDRFNIILFAGDSAVLSEQGSLFVGADHLRRADKFLAGSFGGGGTELLPALKRAYALPRSAGMARSIVVVTDGVIGYGGGEYQLVREHLGSANLFAFGIGDGVNRPVIENLARAGMGEPFIVDTMAQGPEVATRLRKYIDRPALTGVRIGFEGFDAYDVEPQFVPDLLAERPLVIVGKYRGPAVGTIVVNGTAGAKETSVSIDVAGALVDSRSAALRNLWARTRITRLLDENFQLWAGARANQQELDRQVTALGIEYNLLTPQTSFVAVTEEVRGEAGSTSVQQPAPARIGSEGSSGGERAVVASGWGSPASVAPQLNLVVTGSRVRAAAPSVTDPGATTAEVAGRRFVRIGDRWLDQTTTEATAVLRIRVGSPAFARLVMLDSRFAQWAKLGRKVQLNFGHYVIELSPAGFSDFPEALLRRAIDQA
ncbi:MAG: VIT domain-containing protein [Lysobacterales bacterium]